MTRGGFFKRLFYLTSGTGGAASLCYPHEAREIANVAYEEGHKLSMIAYHFATGGKAKKQILVKNISKSWLALQIYKFNILDFFNEP